MVKDLTGWNLLMMCSVSGFDTIRSIRANKPQGPGLLTLWKSETQKTVWLAARLDDSRLGHGKWWYGQGEKLMIHQPRPFIVADTILSPSQQDSGDKTSREESQNQSGEFPEARVLP